MTRLTDAKCRNAKPRTKPYKIYDGEQLYLHISTAGRKTWRMNYSFAKKRKTIVFGRYPDISLSEAREKKVAARRKVADGIDPGKKADDIEANPNDPNFKWLARRWFAEVRSGWSDTHAPRVWAMLEADVLPYLGHKVARTIAPMDVLPVVRRIEKRGAIHVARKANQKVGQIIRFGIPHGWTDRDPTQDLKDAIKKRPKTNHHAKLDAEEIPDFFNRLARYGRANNRSRLALELTLHTFVRTSEIRFAEMSEFKRERDRPVWVIPKERMKMDREHLVPLTPRMLELISALEEINNGSDVLLPGRDHRFTSANTLIGALYKMDYKGKLTVHGFRGMASTILNESGLFESDWIELQLAHDDEDKVRSAYNSAQYINDRTKMMHWWSSYLEQQRSKGEGRQLTLDEMLS